MRACSEPGRQDTRGRIESRVHDLMASWKNKQNTMTIKTVGLEYCGSIHLDSIRGQAVWFKLCVPAREDESDVQMHKIYSCVLRVRVYDLKLMCAKKSLLLYVSSTGQRAPISAISMYAC